VWHGLDILEISIFPFSKTKRGEDNHEIMSLKLCLRLDLRLELVLFFMNHFLCFSLLLNQSLSRSFRCYRVLN